MRESNNFSDERPTEAFLDALFVVVFAAACLPALQKASQHDLLGSGEEEDQRGQTNLW